MKIFCPYFTRAQRPIFKNGDFRCKMKFFNFFWRDVFTKKIAPEDAII